MSAFIVDPDHIRALAIRCSATPEQATACATVLWLENIRSVQHRYPNDESLFDDPAAVTITAAQFRDPRYKLTAIQAVKLCNCLDYQSCETNDWETTPAHAIVESIKGAALAALDMTSKQASELHAYDAAPWTFSL